MTSKPVLRLLKQDEVERNKDKVFGWLKDTAAKSESTLDMLVRHFNESTVYAWCWRPDTIDGLLIANVRKNGDEVIFSISVGCGDAENNWDLINDSIHAEALAQGCNKLEMKTRHGMMRRMRKYGWNENYSVISKDL